MRLQHPGSYKDLVTWIVDLTLFDVDDYDVPDGSRISSFNYGSYQGDMLFVMPDKDDGSTYWAVLVSYGSCSGCDSLEAIRSYDDDPPTDEQVNGYMALALHIVQKFIQINHFGVE